MNRRKRRHSLFRKIIIPLVIVMLCQSVVFFCATFYGGVSATINQNAEDVLTERVINQEKSLETMFTTQWTNFNQSAKNISQIYYGVTAGGGAVYNNTDLQKEVLLKSSSTLISMLRSNEVTGVFLILNQSLEFEPREEGTEQSSYGICIRDYSPNSEYTEKEDLLVVRCPSSIMSEIGCSLETWWDALYTFNDKTPGDYYYKPLQMAYENPDADSRDLAYFDGMHNFGQTDRSVVSYSIPLIDENGYPYAVLGIELTADYLKTLIPSTTLYGSNAGCYVLVQYEEGTQEYQVIACNGILYQQSYGSSDSFQAEKLRGRMLQCSGVRDQVKIRGSISNLQIYNHNTPYENEKVALIGMVKEEALYGINIQVRTRLIIVSVLVMLLGFISVLFISRRLTYPINRLSQKVRNMDGTRALQLDRLNIDEIDDLVESIEGLSDKVGRNVIRMEFFSRMSHDMRTPMNAIIGFSSPELLEGADEQQLCDYMDKIHSSGSFLLTLINEVLDMDKIEMQRMELCEEPVTREGLLSAVLPIISEVAEQKSVHFETKLDKSDVVFYSDSQRMSQVLMNLLSNAVKFTPAGGTVSLRIKELYRDQNSVTNSIVVQDNGCGMSKEFQKKMYEPFSQETSGNGGTGLGLAIARQMITLMGGSMSCESSPGKGTRFNIRLTSRLVKDQVQRDTRNALPKKQQLTDNTSIVGKRVLLCEDHPLNIQIARRLLERKKILVDEAVNGKEGLQMFEDSAVGTYDLILMDIRMPELNGLEAVKKIRALAREDAARIPIIAMTANAFKEDVQESKKAGMNEHLSKPIDPEILYATLEKYLCIKDTVTVV